MADKPSVNRSSGRSRLSPSDNGSSRLPPDFEIRLRSTERIKVVLQRCQRCCAPQHLLIRIRETLIAIDLRPPDGGPTSSH
jgi:hypothetical protein